MTLGLKNRSMEYCRGTGKRTWAPLRIMCYPWKQIWRGQIITVSISLSHSVTFSTCGPISIHEKLKILAY